MLFDVATSVVILVVPLELESNVVESDNGRLGWEGLVEIGNVNGVLRVLVKDVTLRVDCFLNDIATDSMVEEEYLQRNSHSEVSVLANKFLWNLTSVDFHRDCIESLADLFLILGKHNSLDHHLEVQWPDGVIIGFICTLDTHVVSIENGLRISETVWMLDLEGLPHCLVGLGRGIVHDVRVIELNLHVFDLKANSVLCLDSRIVSLRMSKVTSTSWCECELSGGIQL